MSQGASADPNLQLASLTPDQLGQLKQHIEQDINSFEQAFETLRNVRVKFMETKKSLDALQKQTAGSDFMVPLTSSLYVPGKLVDNTKVIVDLGTGYFVKVSVSHALGYFSRKTDMLGQEMDKIADTANQKVRQRDQVTDMLKRKLIQAGQQKQATTS